MIGEYTLKLLCDKYKLSSAKLVTKNNNILSSGEYKEIDDTLNYLINDLNINVRNIEKCPSILYRDVKQIKENINFIKSKSLSFSNIESCLHVLSAESYELKKTYDYVFKNYGLQAIEKITSILSVSVDIISDVESLNIGFTNPIGNLAVAAGVGFGSTNINEVSKILQSKEYQEHPEMFTSEVLAHAKLEDIQNILQSKEYQEHPDMFTSQVLAHAKLEDIQKILQSKEYQEHPELFTSTTLAHAKLEDIQNILQSKEYQEHPELFTSTTLAKAKLEDIQKILQSKEYQEHPEIFTSQVLARAKLEDIQKLLQLPYWNDEKYERLLNSSVIANSKSMLKKLPNLIRMAEYYEIDEFINFGYLKSSPSQNFALINYLLENNIPLIVNNKLNPLFLRTSGVLKKKYGIDLKEEMLKYDFSKFKFDEEKKFGGGKGGIR